MCPGEEDPTREVNPEGPGAASLFADLMLLKNQSKSKSNGTLARQTQDAEGWVLEGRREVVAQDSSKLTTWQPCLVRHVHSQMLGDQQIS